MLAAALPALAGCHRTTDDPAAVTSDEHAQLNDAAATLDAGAAANAADNETESHP